MSSEGIAGVVTPLINEASHEIISTSHATTDNNPTTTGTSSVLTNISSGVLKVHDIVVVSCSNDIHLRLDKIASDSLFTEHLTTFMTCSWNGVINSLDNSILHRFCSEILLRIHCKINWLTLESLCMERM
ncbi:unnamed protein product [Rotaria sp. Silwood1]|nr:unnamed protein product [Rotaria sp. Silwood1]